MAITLLKGKPRSGKSYEAVRYHILPAIQEGRKVVTNIPLNVDEFVKIFGTQVRELIDVYPFDFKNPYGNERGLPYLSDPEDYIKYETWKDDNAKEYGPLFVIDECHFHFPTHTTGKSVIPQDLTQKQLNFFSGHGHWGFDFLLLTQSDRKLNKLLREDIEICFEVRKVRAHSDSSYSRKTSYYGEPRATGLINTEVRKYESQYFALYKSHTQSNAPVEEAAVKDIKKWYHSGMAKMTIFMFSLSFFGLMYLIFGSNETSASTPVVSTQSPPEASPAPKKSPVITQKYRDIPFSNFDLYISGYSDSSYYDSEGRWHLQHDVYFEAEKAGYIVSLKLSDLFLAGYDVSVYGDCMVRLTYGDYSKLIYCQGQRSSSGSADVVPGLG
ncbi:zonular occludens toxin domain-containing protein [Aliivibrio fischeri]|uniref:zonular occludens toxin domain-containing protein n=1 Tax=Aliivibrio fischeri TaxID=668 RepID=UPI0007C445AE|nr:zonular occludens toxin domain-containing protein [Aliivibrio fischeri]MCE7575776.1 hypothetical protein [Aliivibrio fischeri]